MDYEKVFELAKPYLERNDFGMPHTRRVFDIAKKNFDIPPNLEELIFCSIILHDIGGRPRAEDLETILLQLSWKDSVAGLLPATLTESDKELLLASTQETFTWATRRIQPVLDALHDKLKDLYG